MKIRKIRIKNYKLITDATICVNPDTNIFVGQNDSGKSTILEALAILTSGKLNGYAFERQIKANLFNFEARKAYRISLADPDNVLSPPTIELEAYCDSTDALYSGSNNFYGEDTAGIRAVVEFNTEYADAYKSMLMRGDIYDIPVEFYSVSYKYFNGGTVSYRFCPIKAAFIDTTRKDYAYIVDRFVADNITTYLSTKEQIDLSTAFRKGRNDFHTNDVVVKLNESVKDHVHIGKKALSIDLKEEDVDEWKSQMSVIVDETPFENVGFGSQNTIKIELALKNSAEQVNMILMEEPENNLSFSNMAQLIKHVEESEGKQVFISTHSSYVANKLNLGNIFLVSNGFVTPFSALSDDTRKYFIKLPGYDTLRLVLAEKAILVEGPTDELILQKAYKDTYHHLPADDGIDIIVVDSLAFKRYCDIAVLLKKKTIVVTDNDGDIMKNIETKYAEYLATGFLHFFYEKDEALNTIEPSMLFVNSDANGPTKSFRKAISINNSFGNKSADEILAFMTHNKAEWAMRVFESETEIAYPRYIEDAIKEYN